MAEHRLRPAARADLREIALYTRRTWGKDQRDRYLGRFNKRFAWLADHPATGRPRNDLAPGYRGFVEGRHLILYRPTAIGIDIVRILHQSMDPARHIGD